MATFQYKALQSDGTIAEGRLEAGGRQEAFRQMEGRGLRPISLAEHRNGKPQRTEPNGKAQKPEPQRIENVPAEKDSAERSGLNTVSEMEPVRDNALQNESPRECIECKQSREPEYNAARPMQAQPIWRRCRRGRFCCR